MKAFFSHRRLPVLMFILTVILAGWCPPAQAEEKVLGKFKIAGQGDLQLMVPKGWQAEFHPSRQDQPPAIIFSPQAGTDFKMVIHPLSELAWDPSFNDRERVRTIIEKEAQRLAPLIQESNLVIKEISGRTGQGYYFLATDKNPGSGDYAYLLRAGLGVGKLLLSVTLVFRDPQGPAVEETLNLLQEAYQQ